MVNQGESDGLGHMACMVEKVDGGKLQGKRPLGIPRLRNEGNIKMNFKEKEW
jgi:hypothetical protein